MEKFKTSKLIVKQSWAVLMKDREIILFPILSALFSLLLFMIFIGFMFFSVFKGNLSNIPTTGQGFDSVSYVVLFFYYVFSFFIINFFQAGVYVMAHAQFNGQNLSFKDGIGLASKNVNKIFAWSLISATVGILLNMVSDRSKIIGKIVSAVLGAAWNILTYFSLPSLVIGQTSVIESFKDSANIIRKTWGETIIINLGTSFFFLGVFFMVFIVSIGVVLIIPQLLFFVALLLILFILVISVVASTLSSIFKLAIYEYAKTGKVPSDFSPELVQGAVSVKGSPSIL